MANMHAYKIVHSLKDLTEDIIYSPADIISDESTADIILKDGFKIILQTQANKDKLMELVKPGYEIADVDIFECTENDFKLGFEPADSNIIDLESSVEDIEAKSGDTKAAEKEIAPGDYVVEKSPGKSKKQAKEKKAKGGAA